METKRITRSMVKNSQQNRRKRKSAASKSLIPQAKKNLHSSKIFPKTMKSYMEKTLISPKDDEVLFTNKTEPDTEKSDTFIIQKSSSTSSRNDEIVISGYSTAASKKQKKFKISLKTKKERKESKLIGAEEAKGSDNDIILLDEKIFKSSEPENNMKFLDTNDRTKSEDKVTEQVNVVKDSDDIAKNFNSDVFQPKSSDSTNNLAELITNNQSRELTVASYISIFESGINPGEEEGAKLKTPLKEMAEKVTIAGEIDASVDSNVLIDKDVCDSVESNENNKRHELRFSQISENTNNAFAFEGTKKGTLDITPESLLLEKDVFVVDVESDSFVNADVIIDEDASAKEKQNIPDCESKISDDYVKIESNNKDSEIFCEVINLAISDNNETVAAADQFTNFPQRSKRNELRFINLFKDKQEKMKEVFISAHSNKDVTLSIGIIDESEKVRDNNILCKSFKQVKGESVAINENKRKGHFTEKNENCMATKVDSSKAVSEDLINEYNQDDNEIVCLGTVKIFGNNEKKLVIENEKVDYFENFNGKNVEDDCVIMKPNISEMEEGTSKDNFILSSTHKQNEDVLWVDVENTKLKESEDQLNNDILLKNTIEKLRMLKDTDNISMITSEDTKSEIEKTYCKRYSEPGGISNLIEKDKEVVLSPKKIIDFAANRNLGNKNDNISDIINDFNKIKIKLDENIAMKEEKNICINYSEAGCVNTSNEIEKEVADVLQNLIDLVDNSSMNNDICSSVVNGSNKLKLKENIEMTKMRNIPKSYSDPGCNNTDELEKDITLVLENLLDLVVNLNLSKNDDTISSTSKDFNSIRENIDITLNSKFTGDGKLHNVEVMFYDSIDGTVNETSADSKEINSEIIRKGFNCGESNSKEASKEKTSEVNNFLLNGIDKNVSKLDNGNFLVYSNEKSENFLAENRCESSKTSSSNNIVLDSFNKLTSENSEQDYVEITSRNDKNEALKFCSINNSNVDSLQPVLKNVCTPSLAKSSKTSVVFDEADNFSFTADNFSILQVSNEVEVITSNNNSINVEINCLNFNQEGTDHKAPSENEFINILHCSSGASSQENESFDEKYFASEITNFENSSDDCFTFSSKPRTFENNSKNLVSSKVSRCRGSRNYRDSQMLDMNSSYVHVLNRICEDVQQEMKTKSLKENEVDWTNVNVEVLFLYSLIGYKPVGVNRHFMMLLIHNRFTNQLNHQLNSKVLWEHLDTMYDMSALHESEIIPFPNEEVDYELPEDCYELLQTKYDITLKKANDNETNKNNTISTKVPKKLTPKLKQSGTSVASPKNNFASPVLSKPLKNQATVKSEMKTPTNDTVSKIKQDVTVSGKTTKIKRSSSPFSTKLVKSETVPSTKEDSSDTPSSKKSSKSERGSSPAVLKKPVKSENTPTGSASKKLVKSESVTNISKAVKSETTDSSSSKKIKQDKDQASRKGKQASTPEVSTKKGKVDTNGVKRKKSESESENASKKVCESSSKPSKSEGKSSSHTSKRQEMETPPPTGSRKSSPVVKVKSNESSKKVKPKVEESSRKSTSTSKRRR